MSKFSVTGLGLALAACATLNLGACAVGPDYEQPQTEVADQWHSETGAAQEIKTDWWTIFKDPLLEHFIQEAVLNNNNLRVALANVRQARAFRRVSMAEFGPKVSADAGAARTRQSDDKGGGTDNTYDAGFDASWAIDIFGGDRRAYESSQAQLEGAIADYHDTMLTVLSEVARNYYEARGLQKRIAITEQNAELLKQTLDLVTARFEAGESSEFDLSRAEGEYQLTRARVPNLHADLKARIYTLSVLLGKPPEALLGQMQESTPLPTPPDLVPVGLRSDILRRRPDVASAERNLASSVAEIGIETAELFPKFSLTGDVSSGANTFSQVFRAASLGWSFGGLIQWNVFQSGAILARIDAAEARSDAALATYQQTVLDALRDAETALASYGEEMETRRRLEDGVRSRRKAVSLARTLFDSGEEDFLAVLDSERELTASEDSLVVSETQSIVKLVALYTALGGGWEIFGPPKARD